MFCMSVSDIILSIGYALTSLPMPAEMPMEEELGIYWPGPRYGNTTTCNIQGFMTTFGAVSMLGYIATLCMCKFRMTLKNKNKNWVLEAYCIRFFLSSHFFSIISSDYACAIGLKFPEKIIQKVVQPLVLGLPIMCGLYTSILSIQLDVINPPTVMTASWCTSIPYPTECLIDDYEVSCIVGTAAGYNQVEYIYFLLVTIGTAVICLSMVIVISRAICAYRDEVDSSKNANEATSQIRQEQGENISSFEASQSLKLDKDNSTTVASRNNRRGNMLAIITLQAISYIASFFLGVIWRYLPQDTHGQRLFAFKVGLALVPSTGCFNMIVFISSKVYAYNRAHDDHLSNRDVLKKLFTSSTEDPFVIRGISMVDGYYIDLKIDRRLAELKQYDADDRPLERSRAVTFAKAGSENFDDKPTMKAPNNDDLSIGASGVSSREMVSSRDLSGKVDDVELEDDLSGFSIASIYRNARSAFTRQNDSSGISFASTNKGSTNRGNHSYTSN